MIRIEGLTKQYGQKLLFEEASYQFPNGEKVALIGANGAGKSTLLRMICGEIELSGGRVVIPTAVRVGYLPQEPNPDPLETVLEECLAGAEYLHGLKHKLSEYLKLTESDPTPDILEKYGDCQAEFERLGGYTVESQAKKILYGLGFDERQCQQSPLELSGGWRMRLELAKLFLSEPDFLILDEPTNHLDLPSLTWVEDFLQNFGGTLLFVSHDRDLLNSLSTITLELSKGKVTPYKGNFDAYIKQKEIKLEHDQARSQQLESRRKQLERFVERFGAKASKASQAQSRVKMIERIRGLESELDVDDSSDEMFFSIPAPPPSGRVTLSTDQLIIGYEQPLLRPLDFKIERGMRVGIIGANGIGKSTMLRTICGRIDGLGGKVTYGHQVAPSYFSQDQLEILDEDRSVLDNLLEANSQLGEGEARRVLGNFLFRGEEVFKPVGVLSGGEKSRVGLARSLVSKANFLVLDEPTNHLDMSSVEILGEALRHYKGTLLFVSHDRTFLNRVCTHVLAVVPDGRWQLFEGDLKDYQRLAKVAGFPDVLTSNFETPVAVKVGSEKKVSEKKIKQMQREKRRLKKDIDELDKSVADQRKALGGCEQALSKAGNDPATLIDLTGRVESFKAQIENDEERWLNLSEALEKVSAELDCLGRS